jgi:hypothetical protein
LGLHDSRSEFGEFLPEKEATKSKRGRKTDEEKRTRKWKGDLRSINLEALLKEAGLFKEIDSKTQLKLSSAARSSMNTLRQRTKGRRHGFPKMKSGLRSIVFTLTARDGRPSIFLSR